MLGGARENLSKFIDTIIRIESKNNWLKFKGKDKTANLY